MTDSTPPSDIVRIQINDRDMEARKGETIIQAAGRHDIYIPHYCWHPGLSVAGNCRLCLVEIALFNPKQNAHQKQPKPVIACQTVVSEGMKVWTESPLAKECQRGMMELLLANHPLDCPICDRGGECQLQRYAMEYGPPHSEMADRKRKFRKPKFDPLIDLERNRCILCTRCVRFCDEVAGDHVLGVFLRGNDSYISTFGGGPVSSLYSGNIIDMCPVGCLTSRPYRFKARPWELAQAQSTCLHCATGCKVTYWTKNGKLYRTTPPTRKRFDEFTLNEDTTEFICNVGRFGSDAAENEARWTEPQVRVSGASSAEARFQKVSWEEALDRAAQTLRSTRERFGAQSLAVLVSPRCSMEEGYLAARFAREVLGTNHVDWRTWPVTPEAASAASKAFINADGDLENPPDTILLLNGDLHHQLPITALWIKQLAQQRKTRLIQLGHHHDAWLEKWSARNLHCPAGKTAALLDCLAARLEGKTAAPAATGDDKTLDGIVELLRQSKRGLIIQSLDDLGGMFLAEEVAALGRLRAALGEQWKSMPVAVGRNAVGLFAVGAQPDRLPTGAISSEAARGQAQGIWNAPIPPEPGLSGPEILAAAEAGTLKGLVILGQDVLTACMDSESVRRALQKLDTVVVMDLLPGAATSGSGVLLPIPAPWEHDGTYSDAEGNLARLTAGETPRGQSRPIAWILSQVARRLDRPWTRDTAAEVFEEMKSLVTPNASLGFDDLRLEGPGSEFPIRSSARHEEKALARSRSREFNPGDYLPQMHLRWAEGFESSPPPERDGTPAKPASGESLRLVWGPHVAGHDPQIDYSLCANLLRPAPYVELHPDDAGRLGIQEGDEIEIEIKTNEDHGRKDLMFTLRARVCKGPAPGTAYLPIGLLSAPVVLTPRIPMITLSKPKSARS